MLKKLCLSKTDSETSSKHSLTKVTKQRDKQKMHEHKRTVPYRALTDWSKLHYSGYNEARYLH